MPTVTHIRYFYPNVAGWPRSLWSHEVITQRVSPDSSHIEDNGWQHIGVMTSTCQGHVTFPVTWPFDSPGAISYRCSIVTVSISNHFRDNGHFLYLGHDLDLSRSRDVIGQVTNPSAIYHFLLVSYCNRTSISNRFWDIRPPIPVRAHTQTHQNTPQVIFSWSY